MARFDVKTGAQLSPAFELSELGFERYGFSDVVVGPDGDAYVAYQYRGRDQVLPAGVMRFDGTTGQFDGIVVDDLDAFVRSGDRLGLAFDADGVLYVGSGFAEAITLIDPSTGETLGAIPLMDGVATGASHMVFLSVIPEPTGAALALSGLASCGLARRRPRDPRSSPRAAAARGPNRRSAA